jgi:hypothetical protein
MLRYFIRALKSTFLFFLMVILIHVLIYYMGRDSRAELTFMDFILQSDLRSMAWFLLVFGMVHPMIGYVKQKVHVSKPFEEYKQEVIRMFSEANFVLESDENKKLVFRNKSAFSRLMRLYEDAVEIDYSEATIVLSGLRRDAYRFARMIQYHTRNTEAEE